MTHDGSRKLSLITLLLCLATGLILGVDRACGDVIAIGDVTPAEANPDEDPLDPDDDWIPALPQFGNDFEDPPIDPIPLIIVGGTFGYPGGAISPGVGGTATGQLTIDIPSDTAPLESDDAIIGANIYGLGLARVLSLNSQWRVTNRMTIGAEGQGFLEVQAGARVTTDLAADNPDNPGDDALGYDLVLAEFEGSQGFAVVEGFASLLLSTNTSVGHRSQGRIDLLERARMVTRSDAVIGTEVDAADNAVGTGYVLVDGQGTRWVIGLTPTSNNPAEPDVYEGVLYVGYEGRGTLEIANQGWVSVETDVNLGYLLGARGELSVTGQNSQLWALEEMFVGNTAGTAEGELTIADRGVARADVGTTVGELGYVEFQGGTLLTPTVLNTGVMRGYGRVAAVVVNNGDIRNAATLANERELLTFSGTVANASGAIIESVGGEMEFEQAVVNNGQIFAKDAILRFRGGLSGGGRIYTEESILETPAGLPIVAALTVGEGVSNVIGDVGLLGMDITLGDDFSQLFVTGEATLSGPLTIAFDTGFTPTAGQSFEILRADGGHAGGFSGVAPPPGYAFTVDYSDAESVFLTYAGIAPPGMGADFNGDGIVNGSDLAIWASNVGVGANPPPAATQAQGDANGDGVVDGSDFLIIQQHWGLPPSIPAASPNLAAVPEPGTLVLAAMALAPLWARRRR